MGSVGYIPLSEIYAYCQFIGLSDLDDRMELLYIIQTMDRAYVAKIAKKRQSQPTPPPKKARA